MACGAFGATSLLTHSGLLVGGMAQTPYQTYYQVGLISELQRTKRDLLLDPFERNANGSLVTTAEARLALMRKVLTADIFLTGVNAITVDGKLVSTDATAWLQLSSVPRG